MAENHLKTLQDPPPPPPPQNRGGLRPLHGIALLKGNISTPVPLTNETLA